MKISFRAIECFLSTFVLCSLDKPKVYFVPLLRKKNDLIKKIMGITFSASLLPSVFSTISLKVLSSSFFDYVNTIIYNHFSASSSFGNCRDIHD